MFVGYNPMAGKKEKVTLVEGGDKVNMKKPGKYTITYKCKNAQGLSATPKKRVIIINKKFQDDCEYFCGSCEPLSHVANPSSFHA